MSETRNKQVGYYVLTGLLALAFVFVVARLIAAAGDSEPDTGFEVDGNIMFDGGDGQYDWWNGEANRPGYPPAILIADLHSKNVDDDYFSPSGKFDDPANWSVKEGSVGPGQNELTNIFIWAVAPGDAGTVQDPNEDAWLIMGMERVKKSGTFALDFEFNQEPWSFGSLPHVGGPVRTLGDVAVGFELKGNPTDAQTDLQVLIVQFYGPDAPAPELCDASNYTGKGNDPGTIVVGTDACPAYGESGWYYRFLANAAILEDSGLGVATMNAEGEGFDQAPFTPNGETYASYDPQGNQDDFVGEFEFAEAAINLTALGLEPGCPGFGSVHAKSRSSLEVGSDLKDLAGPRPLPVECFIEGIKYLDVNGNGDFDDGEELLEGWEIQLSGDDSATTFTDENGQYRFEDLADGSYTVIEVCPDETPAWVQTEPGAVTDDACGDETHSFTIDIDNTTGIGDFGNGAPAINVEKECTSIVEVGNPIQYVFTVTNVGNVPLESVDLSDDTVTPSLPSGDDGDGILELDESWVYKATDTPTSSGSITNEATVSGDFGSATVYATVSDTDTCTTNVVDASISIAPDGVNEAGDEHDFTITITPDYPSGVTLDSVSITPTGDTIFIIDDDCGTGTALSCMVTVKSDAATSATIGANALLTFSDDATGDTATVSVSTDGVAPNSGDATKHWVDASVSIAPDGLNEVDTPHTFTIDVTPDYPAGVTLDSVSITPTGDTSFITNETCDEAGSGTALSCDVTVNSSAVGSASIGADVELTFSDDSSSDTVTVSRSTDGVAPNSGPATKHWVDASVSIAADAVNEVGAPHTFTIDVTADYPSGVTLDSVSITPTGDTGSITGETCDEAGSGAALSCDVTVSSNAVGSASIGADVVLNFSDDSSSDTASVSRSTDGVAPNSGPATKHWADASVSISPDGLNEVNTPHTFTIVVTPNAPAGVSLDSVAISATGDTSFITADTCDEAGSGTALTCTVTVNSSAAGSATIGAQAVLIFSDDSSSDTATVTRTTNGVAPNSGPATKHWVDASVTIAADDTNGIGEPHTFTINVTPNHPSGVTLDSVSITPTGDTGFITAETCDEAGGGTAVSCTVTVNSNVAGSATISAETVLNFSDDSSSDTATVTRTTDGVAPNSGPATKTWVDGSLTWVKHDSQGNLLGGATFEVCRTHDRSGADIADECASVTDNSSPDLDPDAGEFLLDGLYLGRYTIRETAAPAGYEPDPYVAGVGVEPDPLIELTISSPDYTVNYIWVNVPAEGCTPGWWKNQGVSAYDEASDWLAMRVTEAVADYWYGGSAPAGFDGTTTSLFRVAFNLSESEMSARGLDPNLTLLGAIELGGGSFSALARHGTTALLNSLSVAYEFSAQQVLQDVHDAFVSGDLGTLIEDFSTANERDHGSCPTGDTPEPSFATAAFSLLGLAAVVAINKPS